MYQDALDVQNACNMAGISRSFAEVVQKIPDLISSEVGCCGLGGSDAVRRHPVVVLWASKIADLAGLSMSVCDNAFTAAYDTATKRVLPQSADLRPNISPVQDVPPTMGTAAAGAAVIEHDARQAELKPSRLETYYNERTYEP
jgi:hypothetical protein